MNKTIRRTFKRFVNTFGFDISASKTEVQTLPDINSNKDFINIMNECKEFTMTSTERMYGLFSAIQYIVKNNIPGDIVECGVWRGGSSMIIAKTLKLLNDTSREIFMYDTYEGMSEPTELDVDFSGQVAENKFNKIIDEKGKPVWCYADLFDVSNNMKTTGYPFNKIHFIKGKVEESIPSTIPERIALLRLDTDWYESTYHEFMHLYPILVNKGVLIIDDYGHWQGARQATDKYFSENNINMLLSRIDYTARMGIKTI